MHVSSEPPGSSLQELVIDTQEKEQLLSRTCMSAWQKRVKQDHKYVNRLQKIKMLKKKLICVDGLISQ